MNHRTIPVACIQTQADDRADFETFWPHAIELAEDAARRGARLIVLPEGTVPAYVLGAQPVDPAQLARAHNDVARVAAAFGATIVYGTARIIDGQTYNSASVIGPDGRELGHAEKQFLWHFDRRWFANGDSLAPIPTPVGTLGVLVCADGRIPTIARTLVERGAEILVMPTAWVTSGRDPAALENIQADLMIKVRARENGVPFLAANKCGVELESVAYCGKSAIVARDGSFVARANQDGAAVVFGEIEVGAPAKTYAQALAVDEETRRRLRDPAELLRATQRVRIAFAAGADLGRFAELARQADADVFISLEDCAGDFEPLALVSLAGIGSSGAEIRRAGSATFGLIGETVLENPDGIVAARLAGIDLFACAMRRASSNAHVALARTRAAELRCYLVVLDREGERGYAVDPDGALVAGTFDRYRLASFGYDRARSGATTVAPHTDVLRGLEVAAHIRSREARKDAPVA